MIIVTSKAYVKLHGLAMSVECQTIIDGVVFETQVSGSNTRGRPRTRWIDRIREEKKGTKKKYKIRILTQYK